MYRLKHIESWLREEGVKTKIARARTPNVPVDHVTLIQRGGSGLETEAAVTVAGLQVRCRAQSYDRAEDLAYQIDEIIVPYTDSYFPIWIGEEEHMTKIISATRVGGEPAVVEITDAFIVFFATYHLRATRESREAEEIPSGVIQQVKHAGQGGAR